MSLAKGRDRKRDYNGKLIGQGNDNPHLTTTIHLHTSLKSILPVRLDMLSEAITTPRSSHIHPPRLSDYVTVYAYVLCLPPSMKWTYLTTTFHLHANLRSILPVRHDLLPEAITTPRSSHIHPSRLSDYVTVYAYVLCLPP